VEKMLVVVAKGCVSNQTVPCFIRAVTQWTVYAEDMRRLSWDAGSSQVMSWFYCIQFTI